MNKTKEKKEEYQKKVAIEKGVVKYQVPQIEIIEPKKFHGIWHYCGHW